MCLLCICSVPCKSPTGLKWHVIVWAYTCFTPISYWTVHFNSIGLIKKGIDQEVSFHHFVCIRGWNAIKWGRSLSTMCEPWTAIEIASPE